MSDLERERWRYGFTGVFILGRMIFHSMRYSTEGWIKIEEDAIEDAQRLLKMLNASKPKPGEEPESDVVFPWQAKE